MMKTVDRHELFFGEYSHHEPAIRAFVRRLVPLRSDVDDVMQEVSIVMWEKFDEFSPGDDFRAWGFQIARFKVLARLRDLRRERLVLDNDVVELIANRSEELEPALQKKRVALESCIQKVSAADRDVLVQIYQPGSRVEEIAALTGRTVKAVYQWLHRIRLSLRDCVQREIAREWPT
ncbi:sigma-70 family RNA polymerase sigma factor [Planctomicrobium sp. SH661]|uniref:sigma-70 family RNA polymerase sigma factor n=1 Tax=Planctomicrobium sp. SH661 TaxID=3448124 RepID=UPI003F5B1A59